MTDKKAHTGGAPVGTSGGASGDGAQFAVFRAGGEEYALDIMRIIEIIRPQKVTRIPKAPDFVEGVINLRGRVVPVVDLRKRFGMDPAQADPRKVRVIITGIAGQVLGVMVDEVTEVIKMDTGQVEDAPEAVKGAYSDFLEGVGKVGERLIIILDLDKVLTSEEVMELKAARSLAGPEKGGAGA